MKVLFHTIYKTGDSPYFHYTFNNPPEGIEYVQANKDRDVSIAASNLRKFKIIKNFVRSIASAFGLATPVFSYPHKGNYDLIHSFNTIPITNSSYILELESFHSLFFGTVYDKMCQNAIKNELEKENCKKILFWTDRAKTEFNKLIKSDKIAEKSIVLYPAVNIHRKIKFHKKPTIGFIARNYSDKGGKIAFKLIKNYVESNKANGIIVCDFSTVDNYEEINEYLKSPIENKIKFMPLLSRKELNQKIFPNIDILIYPGFSDSYGFIFPEAASFGIPVLTFNGFARKELVHDEKSGYVINSTISSIGLASPPTLEEIDFYIISASMILTNMISNYKLRKEMIDYSHNLVKSNTGMYSLYNRNIILKRIYEMSLQ